MSPISAGTAVPPPIRITDRVASIEHKTRCALSDAEGILNILLGRSPVPTAAPTTAGGVDAIVLPESLACADNRMDDILNVLTHIRDVL